MSSDARDCCCGDSELPRSTTECDCYVRSGDGSALFDNALHAAAKLPPAVDTPPSISIRTYRPVEYNAVALADFSAKDHTELSLEEGDAIAVLTGDSPEGWRLASDNMGRVGFVPTACLHVNTCLTDSDGALVLEEVSEILVLQ